MCLVFPQTTVSHFRFLKMSFKEIHEVMKMQMLGSFDIF